MRPSTDVRAVKSCTNIQLSNSTLTTEQEPLIYEQCSTSANNCNDDCKLKKLRFVPEVTTNHYVPLNSCLENNIFVPLPEFNFTKTPAELNKEELAIFVDTIQKLCGMCQPEPSADNNTTAPPPIPASSVCKMYESDDFSWIQLGKLGNQSAVNSTQIPKIPKNFPKIKPIEKKEPNSPKCCPAPLVQNEKQKARPGQFKVCHTLSGQPIFDINNLSNLLTKALHVLESYQPQKVKEVSQVKKKRSASKSPSRSRPKTVVETATNTELKIISSLPPSTRRLKKTKQKKVKKLFHKDMQSSTTSLVIASNVTSLNRLKKSNKKFRKKRESSVSSLSANSTEIVKFKLNPRTKKCKTKESSCSVKSETSSTIAYAARKSSGENVTRKGNSFSSCGSLCSAYSTCKFCRKCNKLNTSPDLMKTNKEQKMEAMSRSPYVYKCCRKGGTDQRNVKSSTLSMANYGSQFCCCNSKTDQRNSRYSIPIHQQYSCNSKLDQCNSKSNNPYISHQNVPKQYSVSKESDTSFCCCKNHRKTSGEILSATCSSCPQQSNKKQFQNGDNFPDKNRYVCYCLKCSKQKEEKRSKSKQDSTVDIWRNNSVCCCHRQQTRPRYYNSQLSCQCNNTARRFTSNSICTCNQNSRAIENEDIPHRVSRINQISNCRSDNNENQSESSTDDDEVDNDDIMFCICRKNNSPRCMSPCKMKPLKIIKCICESNSELENELDKSKYRSSRKSDKIAVQNSKTGVTKTAESVKKAKKSKKQPSKGNLSIKTSKKDLNTTNKTPKKDMNTIIKTPKKESLTETTKNEINPPFKMPKREFNSSAKVDPPILHLRNNCEWKNPCYCQPPCQQYCNSWWPSYCWW